MALEPAIRKLTVEDRAALQCISESGLFTLEASRGMYAGVRRLRLVIDENATKDGWDNMTTKAELRAKYRYMFEGPNVGIDLYDGWLPTIAGVCDAVDKLLGTDKAGFHFSQLKEKYGSARIYWESKILDREVEKGITRLIDDAEKATESLCMVCGASAEIKKYGGWFACLCEVHGRERMQKKLSEGSP